MAWKWHKSGMKVAWKWHGNGSGNGMDTNLHLNLYVKLTMSLASYFHLCLITGAATREVRPPRLDTKGGRRSSEETGLIFKLPGNTLLSPNCRELKHKHLGIKTGDRAETPGKMISLPLISESRPAHSAWCHVFFWDLSSTKLEKNILRKNGT